MAAANTSPGTRATRLKAWLTGIACVLLTGGTAALTMRADIDQASRTLCMSALTLATMMLVPPLMSRVSGHHTLLATATTLITAMSAMGAAPTYVNGLMNGGALVALMLTAGATLLAYSLHGESDRTRQQDRATRNSSNGAKSIHIDRATTVLGLSAGISSGALARFQLYAICGASGTQSLWQITISLTAVCALAFVADRSSAPRTSAVLYAIRALLISAIALTDTVSLTPLIAAIFLILDCLTIPALTKVGGCPNSVLSASCPGVSHHLGMVIGATLATTPYFFGDGFALLYGLIAIANLLSAASLANKRIKNRHPGQYNMLADRSGEHIVRDGV